MRWVIIQGSGWENVLSYPLPSLVPGPISYYHCETILSNATLDYKCLAKKLLEGIDMSLSGLQTGPVFPSPSKSDASLPLAIICLLSGLSPLFSWRGGVPSFFFLPHRTGRKEGRATIGLSDVRFCRFGGIGSMATVPLQQLLQVSQVMKHFTRK